MLTLILAISLSQEGDRMSEKSAWGARLGRLQFESGKTNAEIAADCGIHPNSVCAWKAGTRPRPAMLTKLAKSLGVSESILLWGEERPSNHSAEAVPDIIDEARRRVAEAMNVSVEKVSIILKYEP